MNISPFRAAAAVLLLVGTCVTGGLIWTTWSGLHSLEQPHSRQPASVPSARASTAAAVPSHGAVVSLEEVVVNLPSTKKAQIYTLGLRLELELFEDGGKTTIEKRQAGIRHTIIEATYEQNAEKLSTLGGKLYFKETLVARLNSFLHEAVIRDIHFSQFLIQ